jgi:hypothetical protein
MSTVSQLLTLTDNLYPNGATDATVVSYFNMCQNELSPYFGLIGEDTSLYTVADNDILALPSGISDISQIKLFDVDNTATDKEYIIPSSTMQVGAYTVLTETLTKKQRVMLTHKSTGTTDTLGTVYIQGTLNDVSIVETMTPVADSTVVSTNYFDSIVAVLGSGWVVDAEEETADSISIGVKCDRYDFTRYSIAYKDDVSYSGNVIYQAYTSAGVKSLVIYPVPQTSNCNIKITYDKILTVLSESSTSVVPDFDSRFHDVLAIYAAYMICSNGASPDTIQADHFLNMYNNRLNDLWKYTMERDKVSFKTRRDNKHWH